MPKFVTHLVPGSDDTIDLGASGTEFNDLYIDGTAHIDEINIGSNSITNSSGHLHIISASGKDVVIDSDDDITLDANGNDVSFQDSGVAIGTISTDSSDFVIKSEVSDKDIKFKGNDGGSAITALTLDMSVAGTATFNHDIKLPDSGVINFDSGQVNLYHTSAANNFVADVAGSIILDADSGVLILKDGGTEFGRFEKSSANFAIKADTEDADIVFQGNDGGSSITALTLDMSSAGKATFNSSIVGTDFLQLASSDDNGHVNSYVLMSATQSDARGAGVYMHNTNADKEFYAGVPYAASFDEYAISYQSTASHSEDTATTGNALFRLNSSGLGTFKAGVTLTAGPLSISGDGSNDVTLTESGAGDFTIDAPDDIRLDAGGGDIVLRDDGTEYGRLSNFSTHLAISTVGVQDKDIYFRGNDGGTAFTALTLDMSDAGKASFNGDVDLKSTKKLYFDSGLVSGGGDTYIYHHADNDLRTYVGGVEVQKMTENTATFSQNTTITGDLTVNGGDITIGGTGRITGIDTVSGSTDAASKSYVDGVTWMPTLNQNTTGSAASLSGLSYGDIVIGGESGYEKLSGNSASSNKFLRSRGAANAAASPTWETIGAADISGLGSAALLTTAAVSNGGAQLASGDQIYDFVTTGTITLTNKTIDADNNTLSNIEVDNFKASAIVTESEGIGNNDNDTTIPTSAAVVDYVANNAGGSLDIDGLTDIGAALVGADIFAVDDGANGTNRKSTITRLQTFMQNNLTFTTNTNTMGSGFIVQDGDGDNVTITEGKYLKFKEGSGNGININFTDTDSGASNDPYDLDFNLNIAGLANDLATNLFNHDSYIAITDSEDSDTTHKMLVGDVVDALAGEGLVSNGGTGDNVVALKVNPGVGIALDSDKVVVKLDGTTLALDQTDGLSINTSACYAADFKIGRAATAMHLDFTQSGYTSLKGYASSTLTEEFRFTNDGVLHCDGDIIGNSGTINSDIKLKKNIRPLDQYGLNEILKLKPVMYDWKNEEKGSDNIGFIAQDVQEVIPELVNESEMLNGKEGETKLGVEYSKMVAVLTKAIQEQQKQIDELKQIINGGSK